MSLDILQDPEVWVKEGEQKAQEEWDLANKPFEEISDGLPSTAFLFDILIRRGEVRHTMSALDGNASRTPRLQMDCYQWTHPIDEA